MQVIGETIDVDELQEFQEKVGTPFVAKLKEAISSQFASHDIVSALDSLKHSLCPFYPVANLWEEIS